VRALVLVGSVAAHVITLAWIAARSDEPATRRPDAARVRARVQTREPAAIPIELMFEVAAAPRPQPPVRRRRGARPAASAGTLPSPASAAAEEATKASSSSSSGSSLMRMRGTDLRLDPEAAERIASAAGAAPREEVPRSGRLESQPGGRAVVHDTVTTAVVDADGGVTFRDKPTLDVKARSPMGAVLDPEFRREVRQHVAKWLDDPYEGTRYGRSQDLPRHLQAVPGACDAWGSDLCQDPLAPDFEKRWRAIKARLGGGISGTFDVTDFVARKRGGDPYASRKLKLLDETRDERVEMGERHRAQQRARSGELVRRNLERLWIAELDPVTRRRALFELWDECGEDDAGLRARAMVIGWIRARLPRGTAHAFTDDEIAAFRARSTSTQPFAPY
jgi:hypothetical protein